VSAAPRTDPVATRLAGLVAPVVEAAGYDLEELVVTPAGRRSIVRVVVDRDAGVTLDDVAEVSRAVSAALDEHDGGFGSTPYVLEGTSPGVDRPLTEPRHWRRAIGRLVKVDIAGRSATGRVTAVGEDAVTLEVTGRERTVKWADLGRGKVQIEFNRVEEE
jgi:ribosome maturation factor RimP